MKTYALALAALAFVSFSSCNKLKPKSVDKGSHQLDGPYTGVLTKNSRFVISSNKIVGTKTIPKTAAAESPGLTAFKAGLYPKLKGYCGQCHAGQNAVPFASAGIDLAYQTAKKYVAADPEASQIIKNIRAAHNGVTPAWADELAPFVKEVAEK